MAGDANENNNKVESNKNLSLARSPETVANPSRRNLLKSAGLVGAAAVSGGTTRAAFAAESTVPNPQDLIPTREALEVLTATEAETLEAFCDVLIPSDASGPGAKEARAVHYIDRSLASHNAADRFRYLVGLNALNDHAVKAYGQAFHLLATAEKQSLLQSMQDNSLTGFDPGAGSFFAMVRNHTIDGTFCDPYYGGNRHFVGWDMLRYPGVRLGASESDVALGAQLAPNHQSAYDHVTYVKTANYMGGDEHDN